MQFENTDDPEKLQLKQEHEKEKTKVTIDLEYVKLFTKTIQVHYEPFLIWRKC